MNLLLRMSMILNQELNFLNKIPFNASVKQVQEVMEGIHEQLKEYRQKIFNDDIDKDEIEYMELMIQQQKDIQKEWFNQSNSTIRWYIIFANDCLKTIKENKNEQ